MANNREEQINDLLETLDEFELKVASLLQEGRGLAMGMRKYGGRVKTNGSQLEGYFLNWIRNFVDGQEMVTFEGIRETLENELEEIEAGVYEEEAK